MHQDKKPGLEGQYLVKVGNYTDAVDNVPEYWTIWNNNGRPVNTDFNFDSLKVDESGKYYIGETEDGDNVVLNKEGHQVVKRKQGMFEVVGREVHDNGCSIVRLFPYGDGAIEYLQGKGLAIETPIYGILNNRKGELHQKVLLTQVKRVESKYVGHNVNGGKETIYDDSDLEKVCRSHFRDSPLRYATFYTKALCENIMSG